MATNLLWVFYSKQRGNLIVQGKDFTDVNAFFIGCTLKAKQATNLNKMKNNENEGCFMCSSIDHWAKRCPNGKGRKPPQGQRSINIVTIGNTNDGTSGYDIPSIFSVFKSTSWWIDTATNVHVCVNVSMFSSYQAQEILLY